MRKWIPTQISGRNIATPLALFGLVACAFVGGLLLSPRFSMVADAAATTTLPDASGLALYHQGLNRLYNNAAPSVVRVDVTLANSQTAEADVDGEVELASLGRANASGFVWDSAGHILTNFHVISSASQVQVTFYDGSTSVAKVVGTELNTDLAMLKIEQIPTVLQPVILADSDTVQVGDLALAIGIPFGQNFTLSGGLVSAVDRTLRNCANCYPISQIIQTDAPLNPGNSGGPLFNHYGEVIGVVTWRMNRNNGIGFALSSNVVRRTVPLLLEGEQPGR